MHLTSALARAIALIVHELATNAAKYGALSTPEGKVSVTWFTATGRAHIKWIETGGPPVKPPKRQGFGFGLLVARS
jgi:two-component system, chemotaxis family, sensor kinase Cph1